MDKTEIADIHKTANLAPIHIGGSKGEAKNDRRVALTSHIITIFEIVIRKKIVEFLKKNDKSGMMWMDYAGLQVVSNIYQISIHILTTGIPGLDEPRARWTHIDPDTRLSAFSEVHKGLPDMWLIHEDESHFDLLICKESDHATEGCIDGFRIYW